MATEMDAYKDFDLYHDFRDNCNSYYLVQLPAPFVRIMAFHESEILGAYLEENHQEWIWGRISDGPTHTYDQVMKEEQSGWSMYIPDKTRVSRSCE